MSTVTTFPPPVAVPVTEAVCSEADQVNSSSPVPSARMKPNVWSHVAPLRSTLRKSLSLVVSPLTDSSSCPPITVTRAVRVVPSTHWSTTV